MEGQQALVVSGATQNAAVAAERGASLYRDETSPVCSTQATEVMKFATKPVIKIMLIIILCFSMVGVGLSGRRNANHRTPQELGLNIADQYPFRVWQRQVLTWSVFTNLDPVDQVKAIMAHMNVDAMENGGIVPLRKVPAAE